MPVLGRREAVEPPEDDEYGDAEYDPYDDPEFDDSEFDDSEFDDSEYDDLQYDEDEHGAWDDGYDEGYEDLEDDDRADAGGGWARRRPMRAGRTRPGSTLLTGSAVGIAVLVAVGASVLGTGVTPGTNHELSLAATGATPGADGGGTRDAISCQVGYQGSRPAAGRFTGVITVTNTGRATVDGWTLRWRYLGTGPRTPAPVLGRGWNAKVSSTADGVATATSVQGSRTLPSGASATLSFVGTVRGTTVPTPRGFTLNGTACA